MIAENSKPIPQRKQAALTRRRGIGICLALCLLGLTGCESARFYSQAVRGQWEIVRSRKPIAQVLANPATPPELSRQLRLVEAIRQFANTELGLPTDGHYRDYADLNRPYVVWNVTATEEFSLEDKSWWYPVVGSLTYRGYFSRDQAWRYAERLRRDGLDIYSGGVIAFSTLGWFRDPVFNTFVNDPETELAGILFHELAHQEFFLRGDTDFNEAFATVVQQEGVCRWLQVRGKASELENYRRTLRHEHELMNLVEETREQLRLLYAAYAAATPAEKARMTPQLRVEKQEALAELRRREAVLNIQWGSRWVGMTRFSEQLNNAELNSLDTYHHWVPAFRALLAECGGDHREFYACVKALGKRPHPERTRQLEVLRLRGLGAVCGRTTISY